VYHHNSVLSVSLFPFALSAFLKKKMVENLMDVSCEEQVGLVGASGICGGNDIISNHMPWHQSEPCFWDSKFLFRISIQMRKALSAGHSNRGNVSSETEGETCERIAAER